MTDNQIVTPFNKVVITIGPITAYPSAHWVRCFTVKVQNTCDNSENFAQNNSDEIKGYYETEDLESVLRQMRPYLRDVIGQNLKRVSVKMED